MKIIMEESIYLLSVSYKCCYIGVIRKIIAEDSMY